MSTALRRAKEPSCCGLGEKACCPDFHHCELPTCIKSGQFFDVVRIVLRIGGGSWIKYCTGKIIQSRSCSYQVGGQEVFWARFGS